MLLDWRNLLNSSTPADIAERALMNLAGSFRDTDVAGWYEQGATFGMIFTELGDAESHAISHALLTRATKALAATLTIDQIRRVSLTFHVFPEEATTSGEGDSLDDLAVTQGSGTRISKSAKRAIDLAGSFLMILFTSPLLVLVAMAVKLTSSGPVLFRQTRIGHKGRPFTFLKFRSMYRDNDPSEHQRFVSRLIQGQLEPAVTQFKLTADPRVTPLGRFLRKTSLDELPQLFNVLLGEMSLVGPRPPVPYEFDLYKPWHRRRLTDAKPGITGLWQVTGRSRVGFDDMVRLDLRYARAWSLWLDLKILLETPRAVVSGNGAH